jgi:S-adenosyl methyltransferase
VGGGVASLAAEMTPYVSAAVGAYGGAVLAKVRDDAAGIVACLRDAVAPGSYLTVSHIGTDFFPDKSALAEAVAVYEKASERVWPRSRDQILSFFDGFELLEPGLVPKHQWRPVTGTAAASTPNIQWGAVGRKPARR